MKWRTSADRNPCTSDARRALKGHSKYSASDHKEQHDWAPPGIEIITFGLYSFAMVRYTKM